MINKMMQQLFLETQTLFTETLPDYLITELKLIQKKTALFNIHFPKVLRLWQKAKFDWSLRNCSLSIQLITKTSFRNTK
jgi:ATP-dependent DNA helicase RecG